MKKLVSRSTSVQRTPRVKQLEGLFDVAPTQQAENTWTLDVASDAEPWNIGLIVGASGSGKTTALDELFGVPHVMEWPRDQSVIDAFPDISIKEITGLLSSVGFSSPPSWVRPYRTLSNGEQFRVSLARALASDADPIVVDEFTSVVDRTVAQVCSAAVAKAVRRMKKRLVAASCHYDIIDWLQPDWIYEPATNRFERRTPGSRPALFCRLSRVSTAAWHLFHRHHYLSADLHKAARCFALTLDERPVAFSAVLSFPHASARNLWREHRTVVLPDFQGIGVGNRFSEEIGALMRAAGKTYVSSTSHPAMIAHRARSTSWLMTSKPARHSPSGGLRWQTASARLTASFRYVGPAADRSRSEALRFLGIHQPEANGLKASSVRVRLSKRSA